MKELKVNLAESQKLEKFYHNKHIKEHLFLPEKSVRLNTKKIKTKQNPKLKHKYLDPFRIIEAIGNQVYKFKLLAK